MNKVLCYSVRLASLTEISDKCLKAIAFDGSEALIPKSQVFGQDYDVQKSESHWVSAWILKNKKIQYSTKKSAWFNPKTGDMEPHYEVVTHVPNIIEPKETEPDANLKR